MNTPSDAPATLSRPLWHWLLALLGPIAWSIAFGIWVSLTIEACAAHVRPMVLVVAIVTIAATLVAVFAALKLLRRPGTGESDAHEGGAQIERFLNGFALGAGLLFTLVVALSIVPVFLLKACPA